MNLPEKSPISGNPSPAVGTATLTRGPGTISTHQPGRKGCPPKPVNTRRRQLCGSSVKPSHIFSRTRVPDLICPLPRRKTRKRHPLSLPLPDHPDGTGPPPHPHDDNIRTVQYKTCKLTNSAPNHTHRLPDETNCCSSGTSHGGDRVSFIRKPNHHSVIIGTHR